MKTHPYALYKSFKYLTKGFLKGGARNLWTEIVTDYEKDRKSRSSGQSGIVWIAGLPKSGTTMVEQIIDCSSYVQANKSLFRFVDMRKLHHLHGICDGMFMHLPKKKKSFLKTHTHFHQKYYQIAKTNGAKIIVSIRDLRKVMISRYFHVFHDTAHWQHKYLRDLPTKDGMLLSLVEDDGSGQRPIDYYARWIMGWKKANQLHEGMLLVEYEKYTFSPLAFIEDILDFINEKEVTAEEVESNLSKIRNNASKISDFKKRFSTGSRSASTYRPRGGKTDDFDADFLSYLKDHICELTMFDFDMLFYDDLSSVKESN